MNCMPILFYLAPNTTKGRPVVRWRCDSWEFSALSNTVACAVEHGFALLLLHTVFSFHYVRSTFFTLTGILRVANTISVGSN